MFTLQRALTIALSCLGLAQVSSPALGLSGTQGGDDGDEEGWMMMDPLVEKLTT